MFKIDFYEKNGKSPVYEFLEDLRHRKDTNKDARIQYEQAASYIQLLADNGTKGLPKTNRGALKRRNMGVASR